MFGREKKIKLTLTDFETRLLINALFHWRNELVQEDKPTEDVNELLLKLCK